MLTQVSYYLSLVDEAFREAADSHAIYGVVRKFQFTKGRFNVLTRLALAENKA